ncbi:MAG: PilZ domain-containing protein [Myxococcota bacterium]|jgi:hypothetical protein|nr:PilZ domain-containing protein [Myxococcota bacterium]
MRDDERRSAARITTRTLACVNSKGDAHLLEVVNVSVGGCRLRCSERCLELGERVELEFELDGASITATGEVVNFVDGDVGIKFLEIGPDELMALELYGSSSFWS